MNTDKFAVHREMKLRRNSMNMEDVLKSSRAIEDRLFACNEYSECQNVMFYLSCGNEVRTDEMIVRSLKERKSVYVPRLIKKQRRMEVCEVTSMDQQFEVGTYDISEPCEINPKVLPPLEIDAVIAPGLVFDRSGRRIGFGGGYFDWLLKQLQKKTLRLALAYEFQIIDSVPQDSWDERVQKIFTENNTIDC